jgi:hypothetical protein
MERKEPKSMAEVHAIRRKIDSATKGMTIHQKFAWFSRQAKMLGVSRESAYLRKAA